MDPIFGVEGDFFHHKKHTYREQGIHGTAQGYRELAQAKASWRGQNVWVVILKRVSCSKVTPLSQGRILNIFHICVYGFPAERRYSEEVFNVVPQKSCEYILQSIYGINSKVHGLLHSPHRPHLRSAKS